MYKITDNEVDFILNDISKKGIKTEDVRDNILDHVCCIIENEMKKGMNFNEFYRDTISQFYLNNLDEIEEETQLLLTFKYYHAMKRTVKTSGIISILLFVIGSILKSLHLPGAGVVIVLGLSFFSLVFIPLNIVLKYRDDKEDKNRLTMVLGLVLGSITSIGILFKLMHWPTANIIIISCLTIFTFVYIPIYFVNNYKNPDTKFNTIINTTFMIAAVGMIFSLLNLGYSQKYLEKMKKSEQIEKINLNDNVNHQE